MIHRGPTIQAAPQRGNVTFRDRSDEGDPRAEPAHPLSRREVVTLAELNHSERRGVPKRHRDVAATFGVTRSAISQRVRRALMKLERHANPAMQLYAARMRENAGRRIQLRAMSLPNNV